MWTKQPPNTPGFYWLREASDATRPATIIEVYKEPDGDRLVVWSTGLQGGPELLYEFMVRRGAHVPEWWTEPLLPPQ
jgi:hypothetical protein